MQETKTRWRVQIVDVEAEHWTWKGYRPRTPEVSKPHIGKEGWAERAKGNVKDNA